MDQPADAAFSEPSSNLASLRAVFAAGEFPRGLGRTLGATGTEADQGRVVLVANPNEDHYNPLGSVHGGYIASMLDSAMALAIYTMLPPGVGYTTIDLKVTYLRAIVAAGGPVRAEGKIINQGRRIVLGEGRLTDREGRLCAHSTGTYMVLDPSQSGEPSRSA